MRKDNIPFYEVDGILSFYVYSQIFLYHRRTQQ